MWDSTIGKCVHGCKRSRSYPKNVVGASVALCGAIVALEVEVEARPARRLVGAPAVRDVPGRVRTPAPRLRTVCPELDCVRSALPPATLAAAESRAAALGVSAERVLIASGTISEEDYVRALARHLDVPFATLVRVPRDACVSSDVDLLQAPAAGMLRLRQETERLVVVPSPARPGCWQC